MRLDRYGDGIVGDLKAQGDRNLVVSSSVQVDQRNNDPFIHSLAGATAHRRQPLRFATTPAGPSRPALSNVYPGGLSRWQMVATGTADDDGIWKRGEASRTIPSSSVVQAHKGGVFLQTSLMKK